MWLRLFGRASILSADTPIIVGLEMTSDPSPPPHFFEGPCRLHLMLAMYGRTFYRGFGRLNFPPPPFCHGSSLYPHSNLWLFFKTVGIGYLVLFPAGTCGTSLPASPITPMLSIRVLIPVPLRGATDATPAFGTSLQFLVLCPSPRLFFTDLSFSSVNIPFPPAASFLSLPYLFVIHIISFTNLSFYSPPPLLIYVWLLSCLVFLFLFFRKLGCTFPFFPF